MNTRKRPLSRQYLLAGCLITVLGGIGFLVNGVWIVTTQPVPVPQEIVLYPAQKSALVASLVVIAIGILVLVRSICLQSKEYRRLRGKN